MAGDVHGRGACMAGGLYASGIHGKGYVWEEAYMAGGACMAGGHAWQEAGGSKYGQQADGTHPTGMHSCSSRKSKKRTFFVSAVRSVFELYPERPVSVPDLRIWILPLSS